MKVIDLMILKYKNKPLPKKIRFDVCEWKLTKGGKDYIHYAVGTGDYTYLSLEYFWHKLDKEVEILEPAEELTLIEEIEEDKEIEFEHIEELSLGEDYEYGKTSPQYRINQLIRNQKELIKAVNELKKGK